MTTLELNGHTVSARSPDDTPLLWVIRDEFGLTGSKFGCGIGMCGAAPFMWMVDPRDHASPQSALSPAQKSRPSKDLIPMGAIRCKRPG